MGLFSKKDKKEEGLPKLPELPSLPQFSDFDDYSDNEIHELPSFPSSGMGERFSRETIKNAVSGYDEEDEEPHITREELIPRPTFRQPESPEPVKSNIKPSKMMNRTMSVEESRVMETGPVFVRIDKFEEALHVFRETREKINEIEKILEETKNLKDKENEELSNWESEIQEMKRKIEKVDKDIFSKV